MMKDSLLSTRMELEQVLVRQFKLLKDLVALSKKERSMLLNDPDVVLAIVEEKEAMLDAMVLMEDRCRRLVQELSLSLDVHSQQTSIQELLPYLEPDDAKRIRNLSDGITSLAYQAREINHSNHAIALTKLDWLKAAQSFLISIFLPEAGYRQPGKTTRQEAAGLGVEFRA